MSSLQRWIESLVVLFRLADNSISALDLCRYRRRDVGTLVTGGTGFMGANIVKDLALNGQYVVNFDINRPDHLLQGFICDASQQVANVQGNIVDRASVERLSQQHQIDQSGQSTLVRAYRSANADLRRRKPPLPSGSKGTTKETPRWLGSLCLFPEI